VIVLAAVLVACAISRWSLRTTQAHLTNGMPRLAIPVALGTALAIAALFYSSFLASPSGLLEPFRGASTYLHRGVAPATHAHPWHYYVRLLAYSSDGGLHWSEAVILVLAAVGALAAWTRIDSAHPERTFWTRYLSATAILMTAIFSAIPYKTPWNVLPFYCVAIVVAGWGVSWLAHVSAARAIRASIAIAVATACANLGWQAWRASVTYAADPRNPYVYAQTVPDAVRMAARIRDLAALDAHGSAMQVSVIASPYEQWPLPWYLRAMPNVGYWAAPGDPLAVQAPVIVSSMDHTAALDLALGDRYVSEFYGLRPGVLLALYVERGLWDRFLARTAERCGEPRPVAM
jgi:energy-coupling factor transporter transmembrane protein EcfT